MQAMLRQLPMKNILRSTLGRAGLEIRRVPRTLDLESEYVRTGRVPWSQGYAQAKERFIAEALADPGLLDAFRKGATLPAQFGVGLDERCVEYPWLIAQLRQGAEQLLDAGSTLNHAFVLDHSALLEKKLYILTLGPEGNCFWRRGISYVYDDLRRIPFRDESFESIVCLSTLEHIGCDNSLYTRNDAHREHSLEDFTLAMREFRRVLKPRGLLLLSVPFGVYRQFGAFQQFDYTLLLRAVEAFSKSSEIKHTYYRYTADGWNVSDAQACARSEYVEWVARVWLLGEWPTPLPIEPDMAAAARAVACVRLTK